MDIETPPGCAGPGSNGAETAVPPKHQRHRVRRVIAVVLALVSALITTIAITGAWARRTTIDTDHWVATVGPLARDPKVQAALAAYAVDQLNQIVDTKHLLEEALPHKAEVLIGPVTSAVSGFIETEVRNFLATDTFHELWVEINRAAHDRAIRVLEGKSQVVETKDGKVQLNLIPVLGRVLQAVDAQTNGLLSKHVPDIGTNLTADEARAKISEALHRPIPADFGTITVFEKSQLSAVQKLVQWFQRGVYALIILAVLLIIATFLVAPDRRRIAIWVGLGTAVVLVAFRAIARAVGKHIVDGIVLQRNRDAATSTLHQVFATYRSVTAAFIALGLLVALVAFVAGPSGVAVATRRAVTGSSWLSDHRSAVQIVVLLIALLVLLLVDLTFGALLLVAIVTGIVELVLWRLPGRTKASPPEPAATLN
jgi:hypothetical protein